MFKIPSRSLPAMRASNTPSNANIRTISPSDVRLLLEGYLRKVVSTVLHRSYLLGIRDPVHE